MMAKMVQRTLRLPAVQQVNVTWNGITIDASSFNGVCSALAKGDITAHHGTTRGTDTGYYSYRRNAFVFGFRSADGNPARIADMVHDAVHAALDIRAGGLKSAGGTAAGFLPLIDAETLAYLAEAMYVMVNNPWGQGTSWDVMRTNFKTLSPVLFAAVNVIGEMLYGGLPAPDPEAVATLQSASFAYPAYSWRLNRVYAFDGV